MGFLVPRKKLLRVGMHKTKDGRKRTFIFCRRAAMGLCNCMGGSLGTGRSSRLGRERQQAKGLQQLARVGVVWSA